MALPILVDIAIFFISILTGTVVAGTAFPKIRLRQFTLKGFHSIQEKFSFLLIGVSLASAIAGYSIIGRLEEKKHNENMLEASNELVRSKNALKEEKKLQPIIRAQTEKQKIMTHIQAYLHAEHMRDTPTLYSFFVFPMEKYYQFRHVTKKTVINRIRYDWRRHKYSEFILTNANTSVEKKASGNYQVYIKMRETEQGTMFMNIKMNSNLHIYSIGNSVLTDEEQADSALYR